MAEERKVEILGQFVTVDYGTSAAARSGLEEVRRALSRTQYIVIVGPSAEHMNPTTYTFGPYSAEEADEVAYQIEYALGESDRDIHVETLKRGLDTWFMDPDPADDTIVHIES